LASVASNEVAVTNSAEWPASTTARPMRDGEVSLADAGRTEEQHVLGACDEAPGGELAHELLVDGGLELEVELLEGLDGGEVGDLDAHGDALLLLRVGLLGEELVEEVEVGRLGARGGRQDPVEALRDRAEAQLDESLLDARPHQLAHGAPPTASA
jgi:hypothetical protein